MYVRSIDIYVVSSFDRNDKDVVCCSYTFLWYSGNKLPLKSHVGS